MWRRAVRVGIAAAWLAASVFASPTATACACGGVVSTPDNPASANDEVALLTWDGTEEKILMRLSLSSDTDNAALVVPTPTPARVTAGDAAAFTELAEVTAPRVETKRKWTFDLFTTGSAASDAAGAPGGAAGPAVLDQVQLGPLEATTLAGGDTAGLTRWLTSHGYVMRPEVLATLQPYVREGWSFVAMRLTAPGVLSGQLDPVTLRFTSDRLVYPMRMSAAAQDPQTVVTYTLGQHRMQRVDPDQATQVARTEFAGPVAAFRDETLAEWASSGDYLTKVSTFIRDPQDISADFEFAPAPDDATYQRVITRVERVDITAYVLLAMFTVAVVLVVVTVVVVRRRSA